MALETGNYIDDLVITNPASGDQVAQGKDHIQLIKTACKTTINGFAGSALVTGTEGGVADAYTLTLSPALPGYVTGMMVLLSPTNNNTGASTLNINGLGVKSIKTVDGSALSSGDLVAGSYYLLSYDGTDFLIVGSPTKKYVDTQVSGVLPDQSGNNGKYLSTNGSAASWTDPFASPALTGTPTAPTAAGGTSTTQIATTAFVDGEFTSFAVSPAFSGTPTAPTAAGGTNTTQIATTAFAKGEADGVLPDQSGNNGKYLSTNGSAASWTDPFASPALTGTPTAPTAAADTSSTQIATTAFVDTELHGDATLDLYSAGAGNSNVAVEFWSAGSPGETPKADITKTSGSSSNLTINNDGNILIDCGSGTSTVVKTDGTNRLVVGAGGSTTPGADDTYNCGSNTLRWNDIWATNGTIQTSDIQAKEEVLDTDLGLAFISRLRPRKYKLRETGDVNGNGLPVKRPGRRNHYGFIADEVRSALQGTDWAGYIRKNPEKPGSMDGLRYTELLAPIVKAIQELESRLTSLEEITSGGSLMS